MKTPVHVTVTGAAGQIGYALVFRIASGEMLGADQPIILHLLEIPQAMKALQGVAMELEDCAYPTLQGVVISDDPAVAFSGVDYALLVGSKPRKAGMERSDLLAMNAELFKAQGRALNTHAGSDVKVLVVGNPANTNALIILRNAPDFKPHQVTAMSRLDHNRALSKIAEKLEVPVQAVRRLCVWGNHSPTQYADLHYATVNGRPVLESVDRQWYEENFIPAVAARGAAVIEARGGSSAASAANAALHHVHDWALGCDDWVSMAVPSDGSYGIPEGLVFSFPVTCASGRYSIVENLNINDFSRDKLNITLEELEKERQAVDHL